MIEVAVFWDYENIRVVAQGINVPLAESLVEYVKTVGHPHVKKVYCDWAGINKAIIQALYSLGFDPIQVSMGKPNSVDVKLAIDCLDTALLHPSISHFIIITGDKDFIPVVNWLKAHKKHVIIISKSDIVSDHLLLSADDFVSLEELSKMYKSRSFSKNIKSNEKPILFNKAIECLTSTISSVRDQGKSTREGAVDNLMRSASNFNYKGAKSVLKPDNSGTFSSFSKFIAEAEKQGKIKIATIEGFSEIFLIEEDPQVESEFSAISDKEIEKIHWQVIFDIIIKASNKTEFSDEEFPKYIGHYQYHLRNAKKNGELPYTNRTLKMAIEKAVDIGFLKLDKEKIYSLSENHNNIAEKFIENY